MAIVGDAFGKPMARALERAEDEGEPYDLSSLGVVISSGVMWTAEVKEALMARAGCICLDSLGSSEGVGFASQISIPGAEATTAKFQIGEHAKVLSEDGREIEPGSEEIGLLALGGPIPLGYYKDPEKTARTFPTFGSSRYSIPGDWARVAADGTIELLGRGSVSINTGGEKVFPEEVEEAVKLHPAVTDAIVVGVPDDRFGEVIAAVVELGDGARAVERRDRGLGARPSRRVQAAAPRRDRGEGASAVRTAKPTTRGPSSWRRSRPTAERCLTATCIFASSANLAGGGGQAWVARRQSWSRVTFASAKRSSFTAIRYVPESATTDHGLRASVSR